MRIAIFGGTGFVGSYLVDALVDAGLHPVLLVRPGHEARVPHADRCTLVTGDVSDESAIARAVSGAEAVIYNVGILREFPARGITFDTLQHQAVRSVVDSARRLGAKRFLLMSANGVRADGTAYQRSKYAAERYLADSPLAWTVFRPSVIFGDPRGRMEFATQLLRDIIESPLPAPLFYTGLLPTSAGAFALSPVHVRDVAKAFVTALDAPSTTGQVLELGGPEALSWREILRRIADTVGRRKLMLPVPALGVSAAASLLDRFESFPLTRDQLHMLLEGNTCSSEALTQLGISPTRFDSDGLAYLAGGKPEDHAWHSNAA